MKKQILLTEGEIRIAKDRAYHHTSRLSPPAFDMFGRDKCIAKAQLKKAVEELGLRLWVLSSENDDMWGIKKSDWQALLKEIK